MNATAFDFSPTIRTYVDSEQIKRERLASVAGVNASTISRWYHGESQPDVNVLQKWANAIGQLPHCFRQRCLNAVKGGEVHRVLVDPLMDRDGDGTITIHDADLVDSEKQLTAARRREHWLKAAADGQITDDELATQMAFAEREASESILHLNITTAVAHGGH